MKAGLGGRLWSLVHWTNWRLVYPHPRAQQERIAAETVRELQAGAAGVIRFDRRERLFRPEQLCGVDVPHLRAFRMYCSPLI